MSDFSALNAAIKKNYDTVSLEMSVLASRQLLAHLKGKARPWPWWEQLESLRRTYLHDRADSWKQGIRDEVECDW